MGGPPSFAECHTQHRQCRRRDISLADCACLATAVLLDLPVYTADRARAVLDVGADVGLIR